MQTGRVYIDRQAGNRKDGTVDGKVGCTQAGNRLIAKKMQQIGKQDTGNQVQSSGESGTDRQVQISRHVE